MNIDGKQQGEAAALFLAQQAARKSSFLADVPPGDVEGASDIPGASPLPYLTPDAMMLYCQTRLTSINTQCSELMAKQERTGREQAALGKLMVTLNVHQAGHMEKDGNPDAMNKLREAYDVAIDSVGAGSPLGLELAQEKTTLEVGGDERVTKDEMDSLISAVKTHQSNLNSSSELDMIRLQSLMSQRQTAIQLTTNIVQSLNDQVNKVVANIGH